MARKRSDPAPGPTWGQRMRLADEARTLAKIVFEAGGTVDDVLGPEAIEEAAALRWIDPDDLREAIERELARRAGRP